MRLVAFHHGLLATVMACMIAVNAEEQTKPLTIALPATSDLDKLTDLTAQFAGVSIQYNPTKLKGTVRLSVRGQVTPAELWAVFNQVLIGQGFTSIITGLPPVYQVVPINEASGLSAALSDEDLAKCPYKPGFGVVIHTMVNLGGDSAVKALGTLLGAQTGQIRTLGSDGRRVVIAASQDKIREALHILAIIDQPGVIPEVRLYRPLRASPQTIQAATTGAWSAIGRIGEHPQLVEVQVAPDGSQLLLIATADDIDRLSALVTSLDNAEPVESRTYRPHFFGIDEVAGLLQQLLHGDQRGESQVDIVRDRLTNSLIVKATVSQHQRIADVLKTMDEAPAAARRQLRTFAVKHRQADEIAKTITSLISAGLGNSGANQSEAGPANSGIPSPTHATAPTTTAANPAATAPAQQGGTPFTPALQGGNVTQAPAPPTPPTTAATITATQDNSVVIAADVVTNRLIVLGEPRALDQVEVLLKELDQRQPQVQLEITLVSLSNSQERDLGVELMQLVNRGSLSATVTSLFGISTPTAGSPTTPTLSTTGLGGVVMHPGDYAAVVHALDTINNGRSVIKSTVVVSNNAKAEINGVVQEPLVATNSTNTVATTSISGTDDAGTQITITPQISAADYVTLTYAITQSAFNGAPTQTNTGTPIPPEKTANTVSSVATIPDGFVIALGGLVTRTTGRSETRIPLLGSIPFLGALFRSTSDTDSDSRFYVFIHASVLRHAAFADLRHSSDVSADEAELHDKSWPQLTPRFIK